MQDAAKETAEAETVLKDLRNEGFVAAETDFASGGGLLRASLSSHHILVDLVPDTGQSIGQQKRGMCFI
jgi:hypothetical protein